MSGCSCYDPKGLTCQCSQRNFRINMMSYSGKSTQKLPVDYIIQALLQFENPISPCATYGLLCRFKLKFKLRGARRFMLRNTHSVPEHSDPPDQRIAFRGDAHQTPRELCRRRHVILCSYCSTLYSSVAVYVKVTSMTRSKVTMDLEKDIFK